MAPKLYILASITKIMKELWSTVVGSHMWKMATPQSDMDIFVCEIASSKDILIGKTFKPVETHLPKDKIDMSSFEIGHVINMLIKGNINFVWGLTSPEITTTSKAHEELMDIYTQQMAKNIYHSTNGLFVHNYRDYVEKTKTPKQKRIWMMYRTLQFTTRLLDTGVFDYSPTTKEVTVEMLKEAHEDLHNAYAASDLPEVPDPAPFMEFLYELRILDLCDAI